MIFDRYRRNFTQRKQQFFFSLFIFFLNFFFSFAFREKINATTKSTHYQGKLRKQMLKIGESRRGKNVYAICKFDRNLGEARENLVILVRLFFPL